MLERKAIAREGLGFRSTPPPRSYNILYHNLITFLYSNSLPKYFADYSLV